MNFEFQTQLMKKWDKKGLITAEFKYDGQRAQIHLLPDGRVKTFSRTCDDSTSRFPDVIKILSFPLR